MMNEVSEKFLCNSEKFRWFIVRYFGENYYLELVELAAKGKNAELYDRLNNVWFRLPDSIFNISVRPFGWFEFLDILEQ